DASGGWAALRTLAEKASPPIQISVSTVGAVGIEPLANLVIENITATRAVVGVGQAATFTASVRNTGTGPSPAASLSWSAGEQSLGFSAVPPLQSGASTTARLSQLFATPGLNEISCKLAASDDLPLDNACHFQVEVTRALPILLVEGEPKSDPI